MFIIGASNKKSIKHVFVHYVRDSNNNEPCSCDWKQFFSGVLRRVFVLKTNRSFSDKFMNFYMLCNQSYVVCFYGEL